MTSSRERLGEAGAASGARFRESSSELRAEVRLLGVAGGGPGAQEEGAQTQGEAGVLQAETRRRQGGHRDRVSPSVPRSLMRTPRSPHAHTPLAGGCMHHCPGLSSWLQLQVSADLLQCLLRSLKWVLDCPVPRACPFCVPNSGRGSPSTQSCGPETHLPHPGNYWILLASAA